MGGYRYVRIVGNGGKEGDLFNRLMSLPETLEVHIEEDTHDFVATVEEDAVAGKERTEVFFRKLKSIKGVRKVIFHNVST